jgi:FkbM family methyltransferase
MNNPFEIINAHGLSSPTTCIQVGASGGQEIETFLAAGIEEALLIEPLDVPFSVLRSKVENIKNYYPYQGLVHAINGIEVDFHIASNAGMSSSMLKPDKHLSLYPEVEFIQNIKLTAFRLDTVVTYLKQIGAINFTFPDLLYLDVQGAELLVLKGSGEILEKAKFIWTEVGAGDGYKGSATYQDMINFLSIYNFQLMYLECAPGGFGDALFVKI